VGSNPATPTIVFMLHNSPKPLPMASLQGKLETSPLSDVAFGKVSIFLSPNFPGRNIEKYIQSMAKTFQ
jgi:hypothetical protein